MADNNELEDIIFNTKKINFHQSTNVTPATSVPSKLERNTDFDLWEFRLRNYLSNYETKLHYGLVINLLSDDVFGDIFCELPDDTEKLLQLLKKRLSNKGTIQIIKEFNRYQLSDESLSDFLRFLRNTVRKAYPFEKNTWDKRILEMFSIHVIQTDAEYEIRKNPPLNLEEAQILASRLDDAHQVLRPVQTNRNTPTTPKRPYLLPRKCYQCGKIGHIARDCRTNISISKYILANKFSNLSTTPTIPANKRVQLSMFD